MKLFVLRYSMTAVAAVGCFYATRLMSISAQAVIQPFYLEQAVAFPGSDGVLRQNGRVVVARRTDGTTVRIESFGPLADGLNIRDIVVPGGVNITLFDNLKRRTTWPTRPDGPGSALLRTLNSTNADCGKRGIPDITLGASEVLRQPVLTTFMMADKNTAVTSWLAPALGCQELYAKTQIRRPDDSFEINAEITTTRLVLGEPDTALFAADESYVETGPSAAFDGLAASLKSVKLSAEERQAFRRSNLKLDALYRPRGTPRR